jgi:iron-sulfur cluster assembly protein
MPEESSTNQAPAASVAVVQPVPLEAVPGKKGISISDDAVSRMKKLVAERGTPGAALRIAVRGGGCSGMQYDLRWEDKFKEKDRIYEREGVRVVVDPKSYIYLVGTVLNYEQGLLQSGFKLANPQVKASCGCGESFSA